jgi:acyl-CoA thioester hydrolase
MAFRDGFVPGNNAYAHRFRVAAEDIDGYGHANNVVYVRWLNEAAIAHANAVGLGHEAMRALGALWFVRRHDIEYLEAAVLDQDLVAWTWPVTLNRATSQRRTVIKHEDRVLARAETTWVLIDAQTRKPRRVTAELQRAYGITTA